MKRFVFALVLLISSQFSFAGKHPAKEFYEIRVYQFATAEQEQMIDQYLEKAFLPALHGSKIKAGVYKPIANDTAAIKKIYVLIPYKTLQQSVDITEKFWQDNAFLDAGKDYLDAAYDKPAYLRFERILVRAFPDAPVMNIPSLTGPKKDRVYELRSYEGPTEKKYRNKVDMFNKGGEVVLFKRLGFNAVFYSEVIFGSRMPNLMYMTSFDNMESREAHWKTFSNDPEWKKLSSMDYYKNNVSRNETILMHPTEYSDF